MQTKASEQQIADMFDRIAGRYDFLNALLSGRQDHRWRKHLVKSLPYKQGGTFLDVATGTGDVLNAAMQKHPEYAHFIGVDISSGMLTLARGKLAGKQARLELMSAEKLELADASVDCITIAFGLRNVIQPENAIKEFFRVLKPVGELLILEFFKPKNSLMNGLFQIYFNHVLPKIGGLFSDKAAYTYLPKSVKNFYAVDDLSIALQDQGFHVRKVKTFLFGSCALLHVQKP